MRHDGIGEAKTQERISWLHANGKYCSRAGAEDALSRSELPVSRRPHCIACWVPQRNHKRTAQTPPSTNNRRRLSSFLSACHASKPEQRSTLQSRSTLRGFQKASTSAVTRMRKADQHPREDGSHISHSPKNPASLICLPFLFQKTPAGPEGPWNPKGPLSPFLFQKRSKIHQNRINFHVCVPGTERIIRQ